MTLRRRPWSLAVSTLLVASGLSLAGTASTAGAADVLLGFCAPEGPRPCIAAVTRNGIPLPEDFSVQALSRESDGTRYISVSILDDDPDSYDLGAAELDDVWQVTLETGTMVPRVVTGKATATTVVRGSAGSGHTVTVTGRPVTVSGQCDQSSWPWTCPEWQPAQDPENREWEALFNFEVSDAGGWEDPVQRNAMTGLNYFTNVAATSVPPEIRTDGVTDTEYLLIRLANRHFREDGVTVVQGSAELRIPNGFLREAYGVPNPETMTGGSLVTDVTGTGSPGTVTVTQEAGADAMLVEIAGMTFSRNVVRVKRGVLTPSRTTVKKADRVAPKRGKVVSTRATARGAKVKGYAARCVAGKQTVTAKSDRRKVVVKGLAPRRAYDCQVRALSKAGPGKWSKKERLPRR